MTNTSRLDLSPATLGYAALALAHAAAVALGVTLLAGAPAPMGDLEARDAALESAHLEAFASEVAAHAAAMAAGVAPYASNGPMIPVQAARLAPKNATYELAVLEGGAWRVLAANAGAPVGRPPSAGLAAFTSPPAAGAGASKESGRFAGHRYTAYHLVPLLGARPLSVPAPSARPAAKPAKPVSLTHLVKPGETLFQISRDHFGTDAYFLDIYRLNESAIGPDRSNLPVGVALKLPAGAHAAGAPASKPKPAATVKPAPPRQLALALTETMPPGPAPVAPAPAPDTRPLALGAAALTLLAWGAGGALLAGKRKRQLAQQRERFLGGLDARMTPRGSAFDAGAMHSPWGIEQAGLVIAGAEPGGAFAEVAALSDGAIGVFVGDATGSPANAVVSRGMALGLWRAQASEATPPREAMLSLNRLIADFLPQGDHVTASYVQLDVRSGAIAFASASHPGAYKLGADGAITLLGGKGVPLGIGQELFAGKLESGQGRLCAGDALWLFTDGLVKAENAAGEPFGLERLERALKAGAGLPPEALVARVREAVAAFVGKRAMVDDAAIACVRLVAKPSSASTPLPVGRGAEA